MKVISDLIRFLFTHIGGVSILAGLGLLFVCCGVFGLFYEPESQPTNVSVASLEGGTALPAKQWLELNDGYVVWLAVKTMTTFRQKAGSDEKTNEQITTWYVPLASKGVVDAWQKQDPAVPFPTEKIRAYVKLLPEQLKKDFPEVEAELSKKDISPEREAVATKVSGLARTLQQEDSTVRDGLSKAVPGIEPKQILVLRYGERPPTRDASIGTAVCMLVCAGLLFVPLVIRLVRGKRTPPAAAPPIVA